MKVAVLYVGTSLLAPLRRAESEINRSFPIKIEVSAHNCGAPLSEDDWRAARRDIEEASIVFVIHVTDGENAARIVDALREAGGGKDAVIAFNCMPDLMRLTRMGRLNFAKLMKSRDSSAGHDRADASGASIAKRLSSWMADFVRGRGAAHKGDPANKPRSNGSSYVRLISRLPAILKLVPGAGKLGDVKNYLLLFCYFLQPTPRNIRSMLLYAIKHYSPGHDRIKVEAPEAVPAVGIYHPDAPRLFESFEDYRNWYERGRLKLDPEKTVGLLLMRPQIVSDSRKHYDRLIHAIEGEGLAVIPAISTFMDNRDACREFFVRQREPGPKPRVSQVVSLTGFSFVGGPAMNDSHAAVEFLSGLGVPFRSMVSLDVQTIEDWRDSRPGLNPIQAAMQVAIPEIDGATEGFVFGGMTRSGNEPVAIDERCERVARRLARWNYVQTARPAEVRLAFIIYCFPPNKGNIGTAADLDVFPSMMEVLTKLRREGYRVDLPESPDRLRELLIEGNSSEFGATANVAYRMKADEYRALCPYVDEVEREWGRAPGAVNSNGRELLINGIHLGNVFIGVQPTFGYEDDPMRLLMAESGTPHHGFMAFYTYLQKVFKADAVVHVGTHGAMEFMPGKQVGLSDRCWPDRLIGELPNVYVYSVNNPSEGTIAKRRSYAELVSYLTPPVENAGLYKELSSLKEMIEAYRGAGDDVERSRLFDAVEEKARALNL